MSSHLDKEELQIHELNNWQEVFMQASFPSWGLVWFSISVDSTDLQDFLQNMKTIWQV